VTNRIQLGKMVHVRSGNVGKGGYWSNNDYWKLDSGDRMREKEELLCVLTINNKFLESTSVYRLHRLYIRQQRGLLSYEGLDARELKSFMTQRGLALTATTKPTIANLKARLERADDHATFTRFSDFPPEIRQHIFRQYFDSFDGTRSQRHKTPAGGQPPITLVSRQVRLEALLLFYSRCHFTFHAGWFKSVSLMSTELFINNTPAYNFARIRFLAFSFYCSRNQVDYVTRISVNLNDGECSTKVSGVMSDDDDKEKEATATKLNQLLMLEPYTFVRSVAARAECLKLQKNDMLELYDRLKSAVQQVASFSA
jgi:hypothetical protein